MHFNVWRTVYSTPDRRHSKTLIIDQRSLETEFSIAICRPTGDTWQSKTLFIYSYFDPRSSIVKSVFDCRLSFVIRLGLENVNTEARLLSHV